MFFNTIFSRFFSVLASENGAKIEVFSILFRKRRFCKNRALALAPCTFSRFGASKNRPKIDAKTHSKKASQKNLPKIDFGLRFDLPKPPKIGPTSKKNEKKRLRKKSQKKAPWALLGTNGRQAFWDPAGPSNHLSND